MGHLKSGERKKQQERLKKELRSVGSPVKKLKEWKILGETKFQTRCLKNVVFARKTTGRLKPRSRLYVYIYVYLNMYIYEDVYFVPVITICSMVETTEQFHFSGSDF